MDQTRSDTLREVVGAEPPAGIANLPAQTRDELTRVLVQARNAQGRELKEAASSLLDLVPRFLRSAVKRAAGL